mgnify:CR=1 FL=1
MQEEHDKRWKKVAEDVDDLLECFRGFDRAKEKILKRREGILTPFPDGGDWQWECYRTRQAHEREEREREIAEAEASRQSGILSQRISYLADIGGIAPMIGLLGTVIGMIKSFMEIANGNIEGTKQLELAEGVWEALITTAAGLVISIIAMTFYSYFRGRVQNHIAELEAAGTHILALIGGQITEERIASQGSHEVYRPAGMSE